MDIFNGIVDEYRDIFSNIARVWNASQESWKDEKAKEFGIHIIRPISESGKRIMEAAANMNLTLNKMHIDDIIQDK